MPTTHRYTNPSKLHMAGYYCQQAGADKLTVEMNAKQPVAATRQQTRGTLKPCHKKILGYNRESP